MGATADHSTLHAERGRTIERALSLSDLVLGFFEDGHEETASIDNDDELGYDEEQPEKKEFWETQRRLLHESLSMSGGVEARILRKIESAVAACSCPPRESGSECRLQAILKCLRDSGYDCALCKSKWRSSMGIPSGEHRYLDVLYKSTNGKKGPTRILIEASFRAEFEVARANRYYENLVSCLPEVFVGRPEKLKSIIKVMCTAAKECMRNNGLHMGPWRKHKYMQAKWLSAPAERVAKEVAVTEPVTVGGWVVGEQRRSPRSRASMLTYDLLEKLPAGMHCTAVEVQ